LSAKTLIRGGCVLTLGARTSNHPEADVLVEDGRIVEIGTGLRARDVDLIDASDAIVMPGFVDAHRHLTDSLFRNLGRPEVRGHIEHFGPDDVYAATLLGLLTAAEAGITTVVDWCEAATSRDRLAAALQAHRDAGIRSVLVLAKPEGTDAAAWGDLLRDAVDQAGDVAIAAGSEEIGVASGAEIRSQWSAARKLGVRIHAHAGAVAGSEGALGRLGREGELGSDVTLIHCTRLDDADFDAIAQSGAAVVLAPSEEMACGIGTPPVQRLIDRQVPTGLGVGRESITPGDIFAQMRAVISIQHASYFDLKLAGKAGLPNLLNTRETIRYGTVYGAKAAGVDGVTGSLEPGLAADILVLRTDRPNIWPVNDPIGAVVWGMDTSNLDWVLVGGRVVMREGDLVSDVAETRRLATESATRVASKAGLLEPTGDRP
jgi:5-methylthioadenosine/S-adenosylhomocysteine deaminase